MILKSEVEKELADHFHQIMRRNMLVRRSNVRDALSVFIVTCMVQKGWPHTAAEVEEVIDKALRAASLASTNGHQDLALSLERFVATLRKYNAFLSPPLALVG